MAVIKVQSPSYPSMGLANAVDAVGKIERDYRTSAVDRVNAAKMLGFNGSTGPANMALAALAAYGLVERAGKGMLRVTPLARSILHAGSDQERAAGMMAAAMTPALFREIRDAFPDHDVPPEAGVVTFLNRKEFNQSAIPTATRAFLATAKLVKELAVSESDGQPAPPGGQSASPSARGGGAVVGDLVQWESQGVLRFESPRRVRWVSDDGAWVAVEGSDAGIPMEQVIVEAKAEKPSTPIVQPPPERGTDMPAAKGQRKAVFPVSEGDVTFLFPADLTAEGLGELEDYLAIFLKKEKRRVADS